MKLSTSTGDFLSGGIWAQTPAEAVSLFSETEFRHLDFDFLFIGRDNASPFYDKGDSWKPIIYDAKNAAEKIGADFVVAHSHISHAEYAAGGEEREHTLRQLRNSIEACQMLGIHDIVIHGYYDGPEGPEESNRIFFEQFTDSLEKYDVNGLIENGGTADFLMGAILHAHNPRMHAVWDIGHANIDQDSQYDNIVKLGPELRTIHVHDNFGKDYLGKLSWAECDCHMMPYTGTVNFDEVMCALLDIGYSGTFNMEALNLFRKHNSYPWNPRRIWERDTRVLDLPVSVRVYAEQLLYLIGKSILDAYHCFEK